MIQEIDILENHGCFYFISKYETLYNINEYWVEKGIVNKNEKKFCSWIISNGGVLKKLIF